MNSLLPKVMSLILVATIVFTPMLRVAEGNDQKAAEILIFLVDRSGSMATLPEPDTAQAFIIQAMQVARLSGRPVKMAVILFNGNGVKVLGDESDMPTAALKSLQTKVLQQWEAPLGGTPLDEALQRCVAMVKASGSSRVSVVNFSDGNPDSGLIRPELFDEVQHEIDRRVEGIRKQPYPEAIKQQLIERFLQALKNPATEEFRQLREVQILAEFEACKRHAAMLKASRVRFVSVDFAGGIEQLRAIHDAAGGTESDYVVVIPANTVIEKLHGLGLTQLDGIVVPTPVHHPADTTRFQRTYEHKLDHVGEAALITLVFHRPIPEFENHAKLTMTAGGITYSFDLQNSDPNAIISLDSAGNVATATLVVPTIPDDGIVSIDFQSPKFSLHPPELTVYTHLRLDQNLQPVFRPAFAAPDAAPPFIVDPNRRLEWIAALTFQNDPKPLPLAAIEAIWKNRSNTDEIRIDLEPDSRSPGYFRSATAIQVPAGQFDLQMNCLLESGAQFQLKISEHVHSHRTEEFIALEISKSSKARDHLAFGEMGDDLREAELIVIVRSMKVDYPVEVEFDVLDLVDSMGIAPQGKWITPGRTRMTLQPGRAYELPIRCVLPERIEDGLSDGTFSAELVCKRLDLDTYMDIQPFEESSSATYKSVSGVSFTLRRPTMDASARRGSTDEISEADGENSELELHVDIGVPFERQVTIRVSHSSVVEREITALLQTPFRDVHGNNVRAIELVLAEGCEARQMIGPGGTATFTYRLHVRDDQNLDDGEALLRLSAPGMKTLVIPIRVAIRPTFLGTSLQNGLYGLTLIMLPLGLVALFKRWRAGRYAPGQILLLGPRSKFPLFKVESAAAGRVRLSPSGVLTCRGPQDKRERPAGGEVKLSPSDPLPIRFSEKRPNDDRMVVDVVALQEDAEGEPEVEVEIVEAGRFEQEISKRGRSARRRLMLTATCLLVAWFFFYPPVLSAVQWAWDMRPF